MPQVNPGRSSVNAKGKGTGKRRVKRVRESVKPTRVSSPDAVDRNAQAKKQEVTRKVVTRMKAKPVPSPDARDVTRAPAQKRRDAQVVAENIKVSRKKATRVVIDRQIAQGLKDRKVAKANAALGAPVLRVLDQTTRPLHAIAAATDQALHGGRVGTIGTGSSPTSVLKAAGQGIQNKDKTTFSDVVKHAGVKNKTVAAIAGYTADVFLDPTTYVTGGSGSVAARQAAKAGRQAEKKAARAGLDADQAAKMGERARKQAAKTADQTTGVTVKVAGREVPGVRAASAKASKPARAAARRVVPQRARDATRAVGADVNPDIAPAGVSRETSRKAAQATRTARSKSNRGLHEAQQQAIGIKRQVGEANYSKVIDALEAEGKGARARRRARKELTPELQEAATRVRSQFRHANRTRKQAGIRGGERKGYVPHQLTDEALEELDKTPVRGSGRKVIRPSSSKARTEQRSLKELRDEKPGRYSEDLPNLYATRKAEGATSVARAELNRRIADLGRDVKKGADLELGPNDAVFHIKGSDISEPLKRKEVEQILESGGTNGRYVVLNRDIVKRAVEGSNPTLQGPGIVRGLDKTQAGFKRIALATPGFHVRNLVGDTQNAYLGQGGHRLAGNAVTAGRILKAEGRRDKSLRKLQPGKAKGKTFHTGRYGDVTYDQAAEQLGKHGAMRTGYTSRELPELAASGSKGRVKVGGVRVPRRLKQTLLNREDLPRLTTAVDALKKGATWEEAAQKVADYHFDYGHLTQFERQFARRAAPFYTFAARNIPLQTKSLITKPGKFANYEKLREEAAKASGMDEESKKARDLTRQLKAAGVKLPPGWESNLTEWEARNAGVPISWKGHKFTVSMGLPLVDLNEVPGAALGDQINEYYQKGMSLTSPIPKDIIEYMENHSFFFRDELERQDAPLVAAPAWVKVLPKDLQKKMGVAMIIDKKTGKKTLGYRAKADYIVKSIPGTPAFLNKMATQGHDRVGKGPAGKTLGYMGVKATPYDPIGTAVNVAYARGQEIDKRMAALRQQGINAKNPTPEYSRLNKQLNITKRIAYQGREAQGYKVLPAQGGPKKPKVQKPFDFRSGGQDFDFGSGGGDFDFG